MSSKQQQGRDLRLPMPSEQPMVATRLSASRSADPAVDLPHAHSALNRHTLADADEAAFSGLKLSFDAATPVLRAPAAMSFSAGATIAPPLVPIPAAGAPSAEKVGVTHAADAEEGVYKLNYAPHDDFYAQQNVRSWHFNWLGDIEEIWEEFTGAGVDVAVYDDGVEYTHPDLNNNYDASKHVTVNGSVIDAMPTAAAEGKHGTAVAGLIGAENNGYGTVGVAFGADITGVNIFSGPAFINGATLTGFIEAMGQQDEFDVVNHSWGANTKFQFKNDFDAPVLQTMSAAVAGGRDGLGTIIVKSAGNGWNNDLGGFGDTFNDFFSHGEALNGSRFTISVAASAMDGDIADYSSRGTNLLVTGHGNEFPGFTNGVVTLDRQGAEGYNDGSNQPGGPADPGFTLFNGTSSAAPIVSGVISLMLDANPNLGWRDVQNILAYSAEHSGSPVGAGPSGREAFGWEWNGADNWNGGGLHFSEDWGYGFVNAFNAVRMAEVWSLFNGGAQTSARESNFVVEADPGSVAIPDAGGINVNVTINRAADFEIEHVAVKPAFTHTFMDDLQIELIAPGGQVLSLFNVTDGAGAYATTADAGVDYTFGVDGMRGQSANGVWTVRFTDKFSGDVGTITDVDLTFYGRTDNNTTHDLNNDVYHYTDEVLWSQAAQAARRTLSDTDGGIDWINAAAIAENLTINLAAGANSSVYGVTFITIAAGTLIENAVAGDGDDRLTGNNAANHLVGMRGDDALIGGLGADRLTGGEDNDRLEGGDGADILEGGAGVDVLSGGLGADTATYFTATGRVNVNLSITGVQDTGGAGIDTLTSIENLNGADRWSDTLTGSAANNVINGYGFHDTIRGLAGNDTLLGGSGNDILDGGAGNDVLNGGAGVDTATYYYATGAVTVSLALAAQQNTLGAGFDTLSFVENLNGSNLYGDTLTGSAGANAINGYGGADRIRGGDGADVLTGGAGADTFVFGLLTDSDLAGIDRITDLSSLDKIDLSGIDANGAGAGNTAFVRIANAAAFTAAGQLRLSLHGADTWLELNTDADTAAEFRVLLTGNHTAATAEDAWLL